jgi:hypothetical protein
LSHERRSNNEEEDGPAEGVEFGMGVVMAPRMPAPFFRGNKDSPIFDPIVPIQSGGVGESTHRMTAEPVGLPCWS